MFYGKSCNFYFETTKSSEDYEVIFHKDKTEKRKGIYAVGHNRFSNVDACILWAAYQLSYKKDLEWDKIFIMKSNEIIMEFQDAVSLLEATWLTLEDVNIDENECIEQNWFIFEKGTYREDIWHWFDEKHSKGVGWLMNEFEESENGWKPEDSVKEMLALYKSIGTIDELAKAKEVKDEVTEIVNRQLIAGKNNYKEVYEAFQDIVKVIQENY